MMNIDIESEIRRVREAKGKSATVFQNMFPNTPTWDDFINHIHKKAWEPSDWIGTHEPFKDRVVNSIILRNMFYVQIPDPQKTDFPQTIELYDKLEPYIGEIRPSMGFVNFVGGETPLSVHLDFRETIYWQCIGSSIWQIWDNISEERKNHPDPENAVLLEEYLLHPGDVIYIAANTYHTVLTPNPRAALVLEHV